MPAPFEPAAIAGYFRADGLREPERETAALRRLAGGQGPFHADGRLVVAGTPGTHLHIGGGLVCLVEGRLSNVAALAADLPDGEGMSQAAVIAALHRRLGRDALPRLRGSFAVVLWDLERRSGFLAQDQTGRRALYYIRQDDGTLAFASEVKTLLGLLGRRPAPDSASVTQWLIELGVPDQATFFTGVRRVGAAHRLELGEEPLTRHRYWLPAYGQPMRGSRDELAEALWGELENAVRSRVDPGELAGIILSGGIDSSAVAAAAVGAGRRARGYSAVFPGDERIDESERIAAVVEALGLGGAQLRLRPSGSLAVSLEYLANWDLPAPGPGAALEQPLVERAAAEGATVILDGQGGDEIFGTPVFLIADRLRRGRLISSLRLAGAFPMPVTGARSPWRRTRRLWQHYGVWGALTPRLHFALREKRQRSRALPSWLLPPGSEFDRTAPNDWAWKAHAGPRWWAHRVDQLTDAKERHGGNDYLRHRAAIVGADARPPLHDVDLIEFCLRLPPRFLFDATVQDRPLIRQALRGRIPESVRENRVKSNVGAFYYETLAGPDFAPIRRLLADPAARVKDYVDGKAVGALVDSRPGVDGPGWYDWVSAVWRLTTVETWLRQQEDPRFAGRMLEEADVVPTVREDYAVSS